MKEVRTHTTAEITEKKSRFIADIFPVTNEAEAEERIRDIRKTHYDARHHCYAWRISCGDNLPALERASDDGEPQGTAGQPILSVLRGNDLLNTLIVVTRYFGGTLLGTGGLVRAYTQAAQEAVRAAEIVVKEPALLLAVSVDYRDVDVVQYLLRQYGITPDSSEYGVRAEYAVVVRREAAPFLQKDLATKTDGRAAVRNVASILYPFTAPACEASPQTPHSTASGKRD